MDRLLEMTSDARQKHGNLRYAITGKSFGPIRKLVTRTCNVDVTSFSAILSGIGRHFKFCRYVNCLMHTVLPYVRVWDVSASVDIVLKMTSLSRCLSSCLANKYQTCIVFYVLFCKFRDKCKKYVFCKRICWTSLKTNPFLIECVYPVLYFGLKWLQVGPCNSRNKF